MEFLKKIARPKDLWEIVALSFVIHLMLVRIDASPVSLTPADLDPRKLFSGQFKASWGWVVMVVVLCFVGSHLSADPICWRILLWSGLLTRPRD